MDISMPVMDGYDATKLIRELERDQLAENEDPAYVIGLTAHSTEGYKAKCFESGMDDFMTKPVESDKLQEILTKLGLI
jgi:CheY-like chemotaxis protein